jgi:hypothetical protein
LQEAKVPLIYAVFIFFTIILIVFTLLPVLRSLVGAFAGFSKVATIRGLIVLAFNGSGIAGFIAFHNMESANCRFVLSHLSCMLDYTLHYQVPT